jgi:hypothetical protein
MCRVRHLSAEAKAGGRGPSYRRILQENSHLPLIKANKIVGSFRVVFAGFSTDSLMIMNRHWSKKENKVL